MGHEFVAARDDAPERVIIVRPILPDKRASTETAASLKEAISLAEGIGLQVIFARETQIPKPKAATLVGEGLISEIKQEAVLKRASLVIFDAALSPAQQRNLERALEKKVLDRTGLILEVFGARARTREGVLQVSLAALSYQRTRLVRSWTHLERQRGGAGFTGGPGERQIELDRRQIDNQIDRIKSQLEDVRRTRTQHRNNRQRSNSATVALVGYTNVGKSTLFNFLTGAGVLSADQLFATLDPTMRGVVLPSGSKIILSDTVGFIAELPTQLVEAFRATLEEVLEADLILHVHDLADPEHIIQAEDVKMVLAELGIDRGSKKIIDVYNKVDIANAKDIDSVQPAINSGQAIAVSAVTGEGAEVLLSFIDEALAANGSEVVVRISCAAGDALAYLYRTAFSISSESDGEDVIVRAKLAKSDLARFVKQWSGTAIIEAARSPN